jgi:hypothetical protein
VKLKNNEGPITVGGNLEEVKIKTSLEIKK